MCESLSNPLGGVQGGDKVEKVPSANDSPNMMVLEVGLGVHFEASKLEAHMLIFILNYAMAMYYIVLVTKVWVKGLEVSLFAHCLTYGNCRLWHPICATLSNYPLENKHGVARTNQTKVVASSKSKSLNFGKNIDFTNSTQDLSKSTTTRQKKHICT